MFGKEKRKGQLLVYIPDDLILTRDTSLDLCHEADGLRRILSKTTSLIIQHTGFEFLRVRLGDISGGEIILLFHIFLDTRLLIGSQNIAGISWERVFMATSDPSF